MKIDCSLLQESKSKAVGFGGTFKTRLINHPVNLTFESGNDRLRINYGNGFRVNCLPADAKVEDRELMLRHTPSVLGMDVLSKFEVRIDKKKVELIT
jgi:hypothetical protein